MPVACSNLCSCSILQIVYIHCHTSLFNSSFLRHFKFKSHIFVCLVAVFKWHCIYILSYTDLTMKKITGLPKPQFIILKTVCREWDHLPRLWILLSLVVHDTRVLQLPYAHLCRVCFVWVCVHHGWPGSLPLCLTAQARTRTQQLSSSGRRVRFIHLCNP